MCSNGVFQIHPEETLNYINQKLDQENKWNELPNMDTDYCNFNQNSQIFELDDLLTKELKEKQDFGKTLTLEELCYFNGFCFNT